MINVLQTSIFPKNVISGVATGCDELQINSFFETPYYGMEKVTKTRSNFEAHFDKSKLDLFYYQKQIHSDIIRVITHSNINDVVDSDAIITNEKGIMLNVSIADCQAILIYDPISHSIGAVHSGWKGTSLNIAGKTINKMYEVYGAVSQNLLVYLSPSASCDNYEVGEEFKEYFPNSVKQIDGQYYYNNQKEIISQLINSGINSKNVEANIDCTIANKRLHSYRRDKTKSGRMSAFIGLSL